MRQNIKSAENYGVSRKKITRGDNFRTRNHITGRQWPTVALGEY